MAECNWKLINKLNDQIRGYPRKSAANFLYDL
jgi:hypothetical protein